MAQPQQQVPPRAFSPPQPTPSPVASQSSFALPPNKRVRTDAPLSQPGSPYPGSPYIASPTAAATPPLAVASPTFAQSPPVAGGGPPYSTPYTNGHSTPTINFPDNRTSITSPLPTPPLGAGANMPQYTNATLTPIGQGSPAQIMGPPQRPAERPNKDAEYDVNDSLAGTGIDIRAEEQYMSELYANALESNAEARTGFAVHPPGGPSSFYGAGPANQPGEVPGEKTQDEFATQAAERAWNDSAMRLAVQRTQEVADPFLLVANLHARADRIAREHQIGLNMELKNGMPSMGRFRNPTDAVIAPTITVHMKAGADSAMVQTAGSWIPQDAFLVDQLALLSIASKHRLRELVEDANLVATTRQKTSHGDIPPEWAIAAAPMNMEPLDSGDGMQNGSLEPENHLKRGSDAISQNPPKKLPKISSYMTATMRELAKQERELEEARLRKRQKRRDGLPDTMFTPSRSGSTGSATPGSVAPDGDKPMTKKEIKKVQMAKAAEANNHANQNMTSSMFAGLGGKSSLFGKKKAKSYDWMNVGRGGSGTSTPTKAGSGGDKTVNGMAGAASPGPVALTAEGRNRLGTWREDKEKGKNIQLRDWVSVLENDGREAKTLQFAYLQLDRSYPR